MLLKHVLKHVAEKLNVFEKYIGNFNLISKQRTERENKGFTATAKKG